MRLSSILVAVVFAVLTVVGWAAFNQPSPEPRWPDRIRGVGFAPYRAHEDAMAGDQPTVEEVDEDLELLADRVRSVRTYSVDGVFAKIPELAEKHLLRVALGAWIDHDTDRSMREIEAVEQIANQHTNVLRVFVGNEVILRNEMSVAELGQMLDNVRDAVDAPVGTAEPWNVWLAHPELAQHVDFIGIHTLPYWEGIDVETAVSYVFDCYKQVQDAFPDTPVIIAEVGWPSAGRTRLDSVASPANEALFLRRFLARADKSDIIYYVMEAFDQPWKGNLESGVGAYWGIFDADREAKFEFIEPIVRVPHWGMLAAISVAIGLMLGGLFFRHSSTLGTRGRTLLAGVVYATATIFVWIVYDYTTRYLTVASVLVGTLLVLGMLGLIAVLFAEAHEWAEAHFVKARLRGHLSLPGAKLPKVSVHVPAYNEPPAMLIETLDALARLDYPDFEVLVIDNNTKDEALWRPVEAHCQKLGARFRFFHVAPLAGFKAGALNFALRHTAPDAEVVAVIDADYQVDASWLSALVPAFIDRPKLAIMQAPQDYRDGHESAFKAACHAEYRGFFLIGMVTRNERNAIIQHGTMTLVRRTVLDQVGWAEWCITEDAELGLRIFEEGWEADYVPTSYGRGLMPDTFIDFKKQRFRWAYGAMQILRAHVASVLLGKKSGLTTGQRYHFIAGWLPWVADGVNLVLNVLAIGWSFAMALRPYDVTPPLMLVSTLPLALFTFKLVKMVHLYMARVGTNLRETAGAALAGLALSHTIAVAILKGLVTKSEPFFRTPKLAARHRVRSALKAALPELVFMLTLWTAAWATTTLPRELSSLDLSVWTVMLLIQSIPYLASVVFSLVSAFALPARLLRSPPRTPTVAAEVNGTPVAAIMNEHS